MIKLYLCNSVNIMDTQECQTAMEDNYLVGKTLNMIVVTGHQVFNIL